MILERLPFQERTCSKSYRKKSNNGWKRDQERKVRRRGRESVLFPVATPRTTGDLKFVQIKINFLSARVGSSRGGAAFQVSRLKTFRCNNIENEFLLLAKFPNIRSNNHINKTTRNFYRIKNIQFEKFKSHSSFSISNRKKRKREISNVDMERKEGRKEETRNFLNYRGGAEILLPLRRVSIIVGLF